MRLRSMLDAIEPPAARASSRRTRGSPWPSSAAASASRAPAVAERAARLERDGRDPRLPRRHRPARARLRARRRSSASARPRASSPRSPSSPARRPRSSSATASPARTASSCKRAPARDRRTSRRSSTASRSYGQTTTSIIQSSPVARRPLPLVAAIHSPISSPSRGPASAITPWLAPSTQRTSAWGTAAWNLGRCSRLWSTCGGCVARSSSTGRPRRRPTTREAVEQPVARAEHRLRATTRSPCRRDRGRPRRTRPGFPGSVARGSLRAMR